MDTTHRPTLDIEYRDHGPEGSDASRNETEWSILCPECHGPTVVSDAAVVCRNDGRRFERKGDIYILLSEAQKQRHRHFVEIYRRVRHSEGWGGDARYYLDLPFADRSGQHRNIWRIRARSYQTAVGIVRSHFGPARLRVLELGAGNCWLACRLARLGHRVLATDIFLDGQDGLGALDRYREQLSVHLDRAQADMEELPLADEQFDLVVANGSIHYARDPGKPVTEAHRLLKENGLLIIMDSPTYRNRQDGNAMVDRRIEEHRQEYGVSAQTEYQSSFLLFSEFVELLKTSGFEVAPKLIFDSVDRVLRRWASPWLGWSRPAEFVLFRALKREAS